MKILLPVLALLMCAQAWGQDADPEAPLKLFVETNEVTAGRGEDPPPPPLLRDDVLLLPVRVLADALGAKLDWDGEANALTVAVPDIELVLTLGEAMVRVNEESLDMGAAPPIIGGVMYLPEGVLRRVLPLDVRLLDAENSVEVSYKWQPHMVTVEQIAEFPEFHRARVVVIDGEYRGWCAKGLDGPVKQGPPKRHRGDWIIADQSGAIYVQGAEPRDLDPLESIGVRVLITGSVGITQAGAPYVRAVSSRRM